MHGGRDFIIFFIVCSLDYILPQYFYGHAQPSVYAVVYAHVIYIEWKPGSLVGITSNIARSCLVGCFWSGYLVSDISSLVCDVEDKVLNLPTAVGISCQYFAKETVITPSSRWMVSTWVANMEVEQYPQEYLEATILKRRLGGAPTSRSKSKLLLEVQEHYYMFHMECESKSSCILQETWDLERVCGKVRYSRNESNTKSCCLCAPNSVVSHLWQPKCTWYYGVL